MNWSDARQQHPNQWLLVEAIGAHTESNRRILDELAIVQTFPDSASALQRYQALHQTAPEREFYVVHSSREVIEIKERPWVGIRVAR